MVVLLVHPDPTERRRLARLCRAGVLANATLVEAATAAGCMERLQEQEVHLALLPAEFPSAPVEGVLAELEELGVGTELVVHGRLGRARRRDLAEGGIAGFLPAFASHRQLDGLALSVLAPPPTWRSSAA